MPHLRLETNVPRSKVSSEFLKSTSSLLAKLLGKPESYCVVSVIPDTPMVWGGTDDPCGIARLLSLGALGEKENLKLSKELFAHIESNLGIPKNRLYMQFVDENAANLGYNGTTFKAIFG